MPGDVFWPLHVRLHGLHVQLHRALYVVVVVVEQFFLVLVEHVFEFVFLFLFVVVEFVEFVVVVEQQQFVLEHIVVVVVEQFFLGLLGG